MTTIINDINADFWRYEIGVNVIPADTKNKITYIQWHQWQDKPISEEQHNQWKSNGNFNEGIAVILGKIWHRSDLSDYYLVGIDADNNKAVEEVYRLGNIKSLQDFAKKTVVEQHSDNPDKAHFYFYTPRPIKGKSSDQNTLGDQISSNSIPAMEIKSIGNHGLLYCSPSTHKGGHPYEIIGVKKPLVLDDVQTNQLEQHLDSILTKYGIEYLSDSNEIAGKALTPIQELFKRGHHVLKGHNRHEDLLRIMESLIRRNYDIMPLEKIKELAREHNTAEFYEEPLSEIEFEKQWRCAKRFIERNSTNEDFVNTKNKKISQPSNSNNNNIPLRQFITYKYSQLGESELNEAIILDGMPVFIRYDEKNQRFMTIDKIEQQTRLLIPPSLEEYPYTPYQFSEEELFTYIKRAKAETIESLYKNALSIVKQYNDQDRYKLILITMDIVWSYFQDRFGTTHYQGLVGDNGSGKSTVGTTFEALAYRCINTTNPTPANVFRVLGVVEPGQCTLVMDESDRIDESPEIMAILKTGYDYLKKVARVNNNTLKQEYFYTYCLKVIIAERSLNEFRAKGLNDRTLQYNTSIGNPSLDIKETLSPQNNPDRIQELNKLTDFRKLMLVYRLINYRKPIPDIDIGIRGRNKELVKPAIQLFYNTSIQPEIEKTLQEFIDIKNENKSNSLEYTLVSILYSLVEKVSETEVDNVLIPVSKIWQEILKGLGYQPSKDINNKEWYPNEFYSEEYKTVYKEGTLKIVRDKFLAQRDRDKEGKRYYRLNKKVLLEIKNNYESKTKIKTVVLAKTSFDSVDSTDSSLESVRPIFDRVDNSSSKNKYLFLDKTDNKLDKIDEKCQINDILQKTQSTITLPITVAAVNTVEIRKKAIAPSILASISEFPKIMLHDNTRNNGNFHWAESSWICEDCRTRGDIFYMQIHFCKGKNKDTELEDTILSSSL